jgi:hypothetical protein
MAKALVRTQIVAYVLLNGLALCQTVKQAQRPAPAKSRAVATHTSPVSDPQYLQGAFDPETSNLGPNFSGNDPEEIVSEIVESDASKPKAEFETTAQYQSRRTANSLEGHRYVFVIDAVISLQPLSGVTFAYDADEQVMTAHLRVFKQEWDRELNYAIRDSANASTCRLVARNGVSS